ncbi:erythrocyte binding protein, putative [Babesia ovis]|uniref:Erythrocyte binding protein, putative n=1 Tax=Babesia ovis TaxID=5869 RepID=A0A9W5WU69_BABOV|nr:erythrocyte binding protein, putative [Babesia ovis]
MDAVYKLFILLLVLRTTCSRRTSNVDRSRLSNRWEHPNQYTHTERVKPTIQRSTAFVTPRLQGDVTSLRTRLQYGSRVQAPLYSITRNGVCLPEDVGLYGRTVISYECLYTKDGKTQTGDEWEREQIKAANAMAPKKLKKPKKEITKRARDPADVEPYKRLIIPPPYNTTGMLLREGEPYLVLSSWLPGIESDDILVAMDYAPGDTYVPKRYAKDNLHKLEVTDKIHQYYEAIEAVPRGFEQHEKSYNSTYNDVFNQMVENNEDMGHYSQYTKAKDRPPMLLINAPKNTIVKQFEFRTFGRKRDPNHPNRYNKSGLKEEPIPDRIQRAYRPFSYLDLRHIQCNMEDGTLQIRAKLTHIPPPPDMRKIFHLQVGNDHVSEPRFFPNEQVHGWMYNWHHFEKYDLDFDISKFKHPEMDPEERDRMEMPDDDEITQKEITKIMREIDRHEKKDR